MTEHLLKSFIVIMLALASSGAMAQAITGTASYRERIALPPDAVFEVTLEEVSRADAPAEIIGRARLEPAGQPPFRFTLRYDPARIEANHSYTVRARITRQDTLLFATDRFYPVLTRGRAGTVTLMLRSVGATKPVPGAASPLGALPASFAGDLPCADCPGTRWQLDVLAGGRFQLRTTNLDQPQAKHQDDIGRWHFDGSRRILRLTGGREAPLAFEVVDDSTLRKLDMKGQPIRSALNYELKRQASFAPMEPELAFSGMYRYLADAGTITLCATGQPMPVAKEGDIAKLEAAYSAARKQPGDPLLVTLEGRIAQRMAMEGKTPRPIVVVNRYINVSPGQTCDSQHAPASLLNTYWKLTHLNGETVTMRSAQREPHIVLQDKDRQVAGSNGCNLIMGGYQLDGAKLAFGKLASTMMACADSMELEPSFNAALEKTAYWKISGQQLELLDASGNPLARFEAAALP